MLKVFLGITILDAWYNGPKMPRGFLISKYFTDTKVFSILLDLLHTGSVVLTILSFWLYLSLIKTFADTDKKSVNCKDKIEKKELLKISNEYYYLASKIGIIKK